MSKGKKGSYEVGYGKPPRRNQFQKGAPSANPAGRPRKMPPASGVKLEADQAKEIASAEAWRPVTLREGNKTVKMSTYQAVVRSMAVNAIKGNSTAQRRFIELVGQIEDAKRKNQEEAMQEFIEYKCNWEREIEEAERKGAPVPHPIPHPDDMKIDFEQNLAWIDGPMTHEDKSILEYLLSRRKEAQEKVSNCASLYAQATEPSLKAKLLDDWRDSQHLYDSFNDQVPMRYREELQNRCTTSAARPPSDGNTSQSD